MLTELYHVCGIGGGAPVVEAKAPVTTLAANPRPETFASRRATARYDCAYAARIKIIGAEPISCRVVNVSAGGALLEFRDVIGLPGAFHLIVPDALFEADCEVRHQTGRHMGVMFTSNQREALARFG